LTAAAVMMLVRPDAALLDAAVAGDEALARALGHDVVARWAGFADALRQDRESVAEGSSDATWGPRLFVAGEPRELVGWGGFKGPPCEGVVEVGYEIAESRRDRGLATAAVRAMVAEAFRDPVVNCVIAHTLRERNASNRALEKVGFQFAGEAQEGNVSTWRWLLNRSAPAGGAVRE
jgi:[ribosomal protein S5]-alanine N-acetyltransferase